ncbi:hypothetical protein EBI_25410 [Enterocytozoon bieneusi H348]|nr:hypothetical protein EBI_25410 [Enterocytozoon bieneusi H348]|eukprot:XP_002649537.1 hypothetical protein EBI_25410 [Enterocytozoon bieneusi H348]
MFNCIYYVLSFNNFSKHNMLIIKPIAILKRNKKLRPISIWTCISHTQYIFLIVLEYKILIIKFISIYAFSAYTRTMGKITSLCHESGNDSMKFASFVSKSHLSSA